MGLDVSQEFYEDWNHLVFELTYRQFPDEPRPEVHAEYDRLSAKYLCPGEWERRTPTELSMLLRQGISLAIGRRDWDAARSRFRVIREDPRWHLLGPISQLELIYPTLFTEYFAGDFEACERILTSMLTYGEPLSRTLVRNALHGLASSSDGDVPAHAWLLKSAREFFAASHHWKELAQGCTTGITNSALGKLFQGTYPRSTNTDVDLELFDDWDRLAFGMTHLKRPGDVAPEAQQEYDHIWDRYLRPGEWEKRTASELMLLLSQGWYLAMDREDWSRARELNQLLRDDLRWAHVPVSDQQHAHQSRAYIEFYDGQPETALVEVEAIHALGGRLASVLVPGLVGFFAEESPAEQIAHPRWVELLQASLHTNKKWHSKAMKLVPGTATCADLLDLLEARQEEIQKQLRAKYSEQLTEPR